MKTKKIYLFLLILLSFPITHSFSFGSLTLLPNELLMNIFYFMNIFDPQKDSAVSLINKQILNVYIDHLYHLKDPKIIILEDPEKLKRLIERQYYSPSSSNLKYTAFKILGNKFKEFEGKLFIESFPHIKILIIENTQKITHLSLFKELKNLKTLIINDDHFESESNYPFTDLSHLNDFIHLEKLEILNCELNTLPRLNALKKLKFLTFKHVKLSDACFLESTPNLKKITLFKVALPKNFYFPNSLHSLKKLEINSCTGLNEFSFYTSNPPLKKLTLSYTPLNSSLSILDTFHQLEKLEILNQDLNTLPPLPHLKKLKHLILYHSSSMNDFTFFETIPQIEDLKIATPHLTQLSDLSSLTQLKTLHLQHCQGLHHLLSVERFENLISLMMCYCENVSDFTPLSQLKKLENLQIISSKVVCFSPLQSLKNLRTLTFMECTQLQDVSFLISLNQLELINIYLCTQVDIPSLKQCIQLSQSCGLPISPALISFVER